MLRSESIKSKTFTRRALVIGGLQTLLFTTLAGRLYQLQVMESAKFKTLSEENRIRIRLIPPLRGRMLDRNGEIIAEDMVNFQLLADPTHLATKGKLPPELKDILSLTNSEYSRILKKFHNSNGVELVSLMEYMEWDKIAHVSMNRPELAGIEIGEGQLRRYNFSEITCHFTGYVGRVSEKDDRSNPLLRLPDFKIGKTGIEKVAELDLRGTAGVKKQEVNAHGIVIRELDRDESKPGDDLKLAIDMNLQRYAASQMGENTGAVVVLNVNNGEVLTYLSMPGYDSNIFSRSIPVDYWKELQNNRNPLINKPIAGLYPPGSTFKMMTGLAGLESGKVNPATSFFCPGHYDLGNHRFHCWKRGGHGTVSLKSALAGSCDTYFYNVGKIAGIDKIAEVCHRFGLGTPTGIDLDHEKPGLIPDQKWKKQRYGLNWLPGETLNASIGQGYVLTTPVQLALMTAMIANGGKRIIPSLRQVGENLQEPEQVDVDANLLQLIQEAMYATTNEPGGTAFGKRILKPEFAMAGKTGTAQVKRILRTGSVAIRELKREFRHHAWYVGYAPYHDPKYAICVLVEHGESGSGTAAPIASKVLEKAQEMEIA
jgi:penicillin-binding protein 2